MAYATKYAGKRKGMKSKKQKNKDAKISFEAKWQREIRRRREKKTKAKGLPSDFTAKQWRKCLKFFGYRCAYCLKLSAKLQQDHLIPFAKDGGYTASNIVPACSSCNPSKGMRDFDEWYPLQEFYSKMQAEKIKAYLLKQEEEKLNIKNGKN